jgi:hypothetical protein
MDQELAAVLDAAVNTVPEADWRDELWVGTTGFTPTTGTMRVRGGGLGSGAWVARITGTHEKYGVEREFMDAKRHLSGSGRSGDIDWELDGDGIYEFRDVCTDSRRTESGFFLVSEGRVARLDVTRKKVAAWFTAEPLTESEKE